MLLVISSCEYAISTMAPVMSNDSVSQRENVAQMYAGNYKNLITQYRNNVDLFYDVNGNYEIYKNYIDNYELRFDVVNETFEDYINTVVISKYD